MPIKLYSKVIYVINLTICDYNPVISDMKVQNLNLPREGHNFQYIVDYIQFFSKSQHALYFLLPYSYFPILFLLQLVQKLGLSISSTSRWEWHTKLLLSLRTVSTQTPQICYRKDCTDLTFFFFLIPLPRGAMMITSLLHLKALHCGYHHLLARPLRTEYIISKPFPAT